jgi:hypothetical protein
LNYLACHSRPDISFAVQQLSIYMHKPTHLHWSVLSRVFGYLLRTRSAALRYPAHKQGEEKVVLIGFTDSNLPNTLDAKPTIGMIWCLKIGDCLCLISWRSHKLDCVVLSTLEAELAAASHGVVEGIALRKLCCEASVVKAEDKVILYIDNKAAVDVARDGGYYPRLKHVNRRHKFVVEAQEKHNISVKWCAGEEMLADPMTKALGGPELDNFRRRFFA